MNIKKVINEEIQNLFEVRYIKPYQDIENNIPLRDDETIIVYHAFSDFQEGLLMAKFGFTGKETARRRYSYEVGNNPKGLFVSIDFSIIQREFAGGGVIMELATKVSNLEAPVWVGGKSYYIQGEYTQSFKDDEERQQQQLANREKHRESEYGAIANSDRPELAWALYDGPEKQALFVGDVNPNMIRNFWVSDRMKDERRHGGQWVKYSRTEFLQKYYTEENLKTKYVGDEKSRYSDKYYDKEQKIFLPAEDFDINKLQKYLTDHQYNYKDFVDSYIKHWDNHIMHTLFYPKQIDGLKQYYGINN